MNKQLIALLCAISVMVLASPIFESKAIHTQKGIAYLDRKGTEPIRDDFTEGLSKWTVVNYENLLTFKTEVYEGENACVISLKPNSSVSPPIPVTRIPDTMNRFFELLRSTLRSI